MTRFLPLPLLLAVLALASPSTAAIQRSTLLSSAAPTENGLAAAPELASMFALAQAAGVDYLGGRFAPSVSLIGTLALFDLGGQPLSFALGGSLAFPGGDPTAAGRLGLTYSFPARGAVRPGVGAFALYVPTVGQWGASLSFTFEWLVL